MIEFIGKFHPLFVHLPIGFFTLLGVLELLALRPNWKDLAVANRVILLLTIPASVASVVCGWLLARVLKQGLEILGIEVVEQM